MDALGPHASPEQHLSRISREYMQHYTAKLEVSKESIEDRTEMAVKRCAKLRNAVNGDCKSN